MSQFDFHSTLLLFQNNSFKERNHLWNFASLEQPVVIWLWYRLRNCPYFLSLSSSLDYRLLCQFCLRHILNISQTSPRGTADVAHAAVVTDKKKRKINTLFIIVKKYAYKIATALVFFCDRNLYTWMNEKGLCWEPHHTDRNTFNLRS